MVIGPHWLTASDDVGRRRLDDPNDLVRREILGARSRGLHMIPLLVDETQMPRSLQLPEALAFLPRLTAMPIRHMDSLGTDRLLAALDRILAATRNR